MVLRDRVAAAIAASLIAVVSVIPVGVRAETGVTTVRLSAATTAKGLTLHDPSDAIRLGLRANALTGEATVTLRELSALPVALPGFGRYQAISSAWKIEINGTVAEGRQPVSLKIPTDNLYRKLIFALTPGGTGWVKLDLARRSGDRVQAILKNLPTTVIAVDDYDSVEGKASWYQSVKYPNGAASNDFPMGTQLLVTNLDNGKKTTVKVVSTGPFVAGRVIDLTHGPFALIASRGAGIANVRVERLVRAAIATKEPAADTDASGTPIAGTGALSAIPNVTAASALVVDQGSETELFAKNADTVRPIASLTKLVAVSVFLDTNPDLSKIVAYRSVDGATCSCLRMSVGETARLSDFLGAALVGSANNATKVLARSSGLPFDAFVSAMNAKAVAWGASTAHFHEPTGLDPLNVASARDMVKIAEGAFREHPLIRDLVLRPSYSFRTVSAGVLHTIKTTNPLLSTSTLRITGGKTGYLEEAGFTFVLRARDAAGHQVIAVILGEPSAAARFTQAEQLLGWAFGHYTWSA